MANPLSGTPQPTGNKPFADMARGEVRMHRVTNDRLGIDRLLEVERTDRPFAHDMADAHNRAMDSDCRRRGLEWYVTPAGELKLGTNQQAMIAAVKADKARQERERQQWIANQRKLETVRVRELEDA